MTTTSADTWIDAARRSHDRLADLLTPLTEAELTGTSGASEWTIADVASHLGSQAEIFGLLVASWQEGTDAPGPEVFGPIWDRWNAMSPTEQAASSVATNEHFVAAVEALTPEQRAAFRISVFGGERDLAGLMVMKYGEHAVHGWDIAVGLDPTAVLPADAVDLLIDELAGPGGRGTPVPGVAPIAVVTTDPERQFLVTVDPAVVVAQTDAPTPDAVPLSAENLIRLVYGRLAADPGADARVATLRPAFPGF